MSSAPGAHDGGSGDGWHPLAQRIAGQARDFLDGVGALATGEGGDEMVPLLLLEVSQILLAGAQLGASKDVIPPGNWEPDVGADPDLDVLRSGLAVRLAGCDEYADLFDPYADSRPTRVPALRRSRGRGRGPHPRAAALRGGPPAGSAVVVAVLLRQPLGHPRRGGAAGAARRRGARHCSTWPRRS